MVSIKIKTRLNFLKPIRNSSPMDTDLASCLSFENTVNVLKIASDDLLDEFHGTGLP